MCIVYKIFNFKRLAAVFISQWHTATWLMEVDSDAKWPTLDLVSQALLLWVSPSSHKRSDLVNMDRQTGPLRKIFSLTVPIRWSPFMCLLLPRGIAVTWHPKTADLPNRGHRNVIAETTGISRLLLNFLPTPPLLQPFGHSGSRTSCGRGSAANRNTVFLLPQESWRACKSHCFCSPAPGDLWWPGSH